MRAAARAIAFTLATDLLATAGIAHAQRTSADAAATALFDEGRRLMDQHRWGEACPKLAESEKLAPSGGTLINLAECYEHAGLTASAWVAWKEAAARADAAGKADVERKALARSTALEPSLARLTIAVDRASDVDGLEVRRDGVAVGHAEFSMAIPVDPGTHTIEANAPKRKAFSTTVEVAAKQTDARVTVSLGTEVVVAPVGPPDVGPGGTTTTTPPTGERPSQEGSRWSTQKTVALVVGGAGVAGVAIGAAFGLDAMSKNSQAKTDCRTNTLCSQNGLNLTSSAQSSATVSNIAFAAGGAALAGGIVLFLTAPSSSTKAGVQVLPVVGLSYQGVALHAAW